MIHNCLIFSFMELKSCEFRDEYLESILSRRTWSSHFIQFLRCLVLDDFKVRIENHLNADELNYPS